MVTRTLKQVKVFDIKAYGQTLSGHGYFDEIPGITWNLGQVWESEEECARLLKAAVADWEDRRNKNPWGTTDHKPELVVYWQTLEAVEE
jgi:hypothetical protein